MIREFKNADYGIVRATVVKKQPYFCLIDIARLFGIQNSKTCLFKIPSSDIEKIEISQEKNKNKRIFINAKHINTCLFKSKKTEAQLIIDWLYRIVIPQLIKYIEYDMILKLQKGIINVEEFIKEIDNWFN